MVFALALKLETWHIDAHYLGHWSCYNRQQMEKQNNRPRGRLL